MVIDFDKPPDSDAVTLQVNKALQNTERFLSQLIALFVPFVFLLSRPKCNP